MIRFIVGRNGNVKSKKRNGDDSSKSNLDLAEKPIKAQPTPAKTSHKVLPVANSTRTSVVKEEPKLKSHRQSSASTLRPPPAKQPASQRDDHYLSDEEIDTFPCKTPTQNCYTRPSSKLAKAQTQTQLSLQKLQPPKDEAQTLTQNTPRDSPAQERKEKKESSHRSSVPAPVHQAVQGQHHHIQPHNGEKKALLIKKGTQLNLAALVQYE